MNQQSQMPTFQYQSKLLLQLHVLLPEDSHVGHGLVRAILKDSNDGLASSTDYPDLTWLDSGVLFSAA